MLGVCDYTRERLIKLHAALRLVQTPTCVNGFAVPAPGPCPEEPSGPGTVGSWQAGRHHTQVGGEAVTCAPEEHETGQMGGRGQLGNLARSLVTFRPQLEGHQEEGLVGALDQSTSFCRN